MIRPGLTLMAAVAILAGCTSTATTAPAKPSPLVITRMKVRPSEPRRPAGWIYAFRRPDDQPDLCVTIWSDETWTLWATLPQGHSSNKLDSGRILQGNVVAFPAARFRSAGLVYVAGAIDAEFDGQPIGRDEEHDDEDS